MFNADTMLFNNGKWMFYRGQVPCGAISAYDLYQRYNTLNAQDRITADGFFAAMGKSQAVYNNTLSSDTRPMPPITPKGWGTIDTSVEKQPAPNKAARRKIGRECITIRVNGGGTSVTWQEQTFILDDLSDSERQQLLTKIAERIVM